MRDQAHVEGVVSMLVERFEGQHLERLLQLKSAVDAGERLAEHHHAFLEDVCQEALDAKHLVDQHPEYHELYSRAVRLYKQIAEQALLNERAAPRQANAAPSPATP